MEIHLSALVFAPLAGMFVILALPSAARGLIRCAAAVATLVPLGLASWLFERFDRSADEFQFTERYAWIPAFDIHYFVGVDGMSIVLLLLTTFLSFLGVVASWRIDKGVKGYFALFLLLETAMLGVLVSLDLVLLFAFWELTLLPLALLIGIWGGPRSQPAVLKFVLFTMAGSFFVLVSILVLYFATEPRTFDLTVLMASQNQYPQSLQYVLWVALFIGFGVKIPVFPLHAWMPDAHVEAPPAISILLAGVLLKLGVYAVLRVNFAIFPAATAELAYVCLGTLGVVNIVYGAFCALGQRDLKRMVAYVSMSHMGYVLIGLAAFNAPGSEGAVLHMVNHGIVVAMLFLLINGLEERAAHRQVYGFGGLATVMPVYTGFVALASFAALGLPGLATFVSELLVLLGSWQRHPGLAALGAAAIVITAACMVWTLQRVFLGPLNERYAEVADIGAREAALLTPLAVLVIGVGIYPQPLLEAIAQPLQRLNTAIHWFL